MHVETARRQLLEQHGRLRDILATCTRLARLFREGVDTGIELELALKALREEFVIHNEAETAVIRKLLHGPAAWGSLMIDRMFEEHVAEHAAFWEVLSGTRREIAANIDGLADELDAHMAAEERTFLAPTTLRADVLETRLREEPAE